MAPRVLARMTGMCTPTIASGCVHIYETYEFEAGNWLRYKLIIDLDLLSRYYLG